MIHRKYRFEGLTLTVPVNYDEQAQRWIEDYSEFIETRIVTPSGHPIMFAGEDACSLAEEATPGGCPDCGSCRFYRRVDERCWLGWCVLEAMECMKPD